MTTLRSEYIRTGLVLLLGLELSLKTWKLGLGDGRHRRVREVRAGDVDAVLREVAVAKRKFGMSEDMKVVAVYEAGRDGFWLYRRLLELGVRTLVIDAGSVAQKSKKRRRKNDRLDAQQLLGLLIRYELCGETDVFSVCRVPSQEVEDERRTTRELERLKQEETGHRSRIRSLLTLHGLDRSVTKKGFLSWLALAPLLPHAKAEILREYTRLQLVWNHEGTIEKEQASALRKVAEAVGATSPTKLSGQAKRLQIVRLLLALKGIGPAGAWTLTYEFFGWRQFSRAKSVGAGAGLIPGEFASGNLDRELSITKAGNRRIRRLMTQLAWLWIRYQPETEISRWFTERFASGPSKRRRVGIVAASRKLLVALWRYVEHGVVIEGATYTDCALAA